MNQVNKPPRLVERLDVECEEDRLHRFRKYVSVELFMRDLYGRLSAGYSLEKLDRDSTSGNNVTPSFNFEYRNRAPHPINPPAERTFEIVNLKDTQAQADASHQFFHESKPFSLHLKHRTLFSRNVPMQILKAWILST